MEPISLTGWNRDVVVESTAAGPAFTAALELNPNEGTAFYEQGLPGHSYGLPVGGSFTSVVGDGTVFQLQPYTGSNALVLSSQTGLTAGTLALLIPNGFSRIAVIAHSASGGGTPNLTLNFSDGSSATTAYNAQDWFNNEGYALAGMERIVLSNGGTQGAPNNPRFYQTSIDLAAFGAVGRTLASITFNKAAGVGATAIYGVSGEMAAQTPAVIVTHPTNLTVKELTAATFTAGAAGNPTPRVQWQRNGSAIGGATRASYTIPTVSLADDGAGFRMVADNVASNISYVVTSAVATLTVLADTNGPALIWAQSSGLNQVLARFSERLSPSTATNLANYSVVGTNGVPIGIVSATLDGSQSNVVLTVSVLTDRAPYTFTVNNVTDQAAAANRIAPNSQAQFIASSYMMADLGEGVLRGSQVPAGNGWDVSGAGADLGGTSDQSHFSYQPRTGDFDVRVRLGSLTLADAWSEAGMAAREDLSPGSRSASVMATPSISGCYFQSRSSTNGGTALSGSFPVNYPNTWLRLKRAGNTFSGYAGFDGRDWTLLGTMTANMPPTIFFGFAVSSHDPGRLATGAFRDFSQVAESGVHGPLPFEPLSQCSRRTSLVLSEVMYHPTNAALEYVEVFNSRGEFQDLSGWKLAGSAEYTFPPGTVLAGGGFLVVGRSPGELQNVYGISGVLGPFTNNLPNDSGTVRLINPGGGVMLEVEYSDEGRWPAAADGAGHSLVLRRASYGENDPQAWSWSDAVGGSPGRLEPYTPDPLRSLMINELLAHTDAPELDYIELHNHSATALEITGCILTDDASTNKFVVPSRTIPAHGFVAYTEAELGFSLNAAGETIHLFSPDHKRVLDCVKYDAQENGVASGRYPNGSEEFYRLQSKTPGQPNPAILVGEVVINEIMYHPVSENEEEQYIELHNQGNAPVNLSGWRLQDGIGYSFPSNTVLGAGAYVVVAKNAARLLSVYPNLSAANVFGNFTGRLSGQGERVVLTKPDTIISTNSSGVATTNLIHIAVDEVSYGTGGNWGQWADGGGSSLELVNPRSNHRLASNWADSDETRKAPWAIVSATGRIDNGSTTANQLQVLLGGAGECLVDDVQVLTSTGSNLVANSSFESGAEGWTAEGTEWQSGLESNEGFNSSRSYRIRAVDRGDNQVNRVRTPLTTSLASGTTNVTIRAAVRWLKGFPEVLFRLRGNWLECDGLMALPTSPGTPGARNSRYAVNAGPAIYEVHHSPTLPQANQAILVTARVEDPDGLQEVSASYRRDPASTYSTVLMGDTGTGGDLVAGDGVFSGTIPGQASGAMVAFYVEATDSLTPPESARYPASAPTQECLVRVGESTPTGNFPVYRIWMTQSTLNTWTSRHKLDNSPLPVTFVSGDNRSFYGAQALYAGSPYIAPGYCGPACGRCGYTLSVPKDDLFLGETDHVLDWPGGHGNETTAIQEQMGYWIAEQLKLAYSHRYTIRLHVNGVTDADRRAVFEGSQQPAKRFLEQWSPSQPEGQFFKIERAFEFNDSGGLITAPEPRLENYTTVGGAKKLEKYRWNWIYRGSNRINDYTNLFALVDAVNAASPEPYTSSTLGMADVEQWMRIFAVEHIIVNFDAYGHVIGKNMYAFLPEGGKWQLYMFDLDWLMLAATNFRSDYAASSAPLFACEDPTITRMYNHPPFLRAYWRAVRDAINGPFAPEVCEPVMDAKYRSLAGNGIVWCDGQALTDPSAVKVWFSQRRAFLQSQLATVSTAFTVNPTVAISNGLGLVSGTAPVEVETVFINGQEWTVRWTSVNGWTATVPLAPGNNSFSIVGVDTSNQAVMGASNVVSVVYSGTNVSPVGKVLLNEIMWNPSVPGGQYVELFNTSTTNAFDLSGWNLNGLGYTFPGGAFLHPRGYLVLTRDRAAFDMAHGPSLYVYDQFDGALQADGETLTLIKPGATPGVDVVVDQVRYEAAAPWHRPAAGGSLQVIDPDQDQSRVANWAAGRATPLVSPHWVYAWTNITATSSRLYIYLQSAGEVYLDDVKLVAGSVPEAGQNLIRNGGFESALGTDWSTAGSFTQSTNSSAFVHLGTNSLFMIASAAGTGSGNSVYQDVSPALTNGTVYTLSFWYRQTTNGGPLVARLSGASVTPTFALAPASEFVGARATPGAANSFTNRFPAFPTVWLNELQAENVTGPLDNFGERDPWIELHNPGTNPVSLSGLYLGTNYASASQWAFPPNASIGPGQFLVIWADGQPQQSGGGSLHTDFRLPGGSGALALSRFVGNALQIVDYLTYSALPANYSYGDLPDSQPFYRQAMYRATPAGTNSSQLPAVTVSVNEWMADNSGGLLDPATGAYEDWFELYNPSDVEADLAGYYLTDNLTNQFQFRIPTGFRVPSKGFLLVWADSRSSANTNLTDLHVSFKLAKEGEAIGLFAPDGTLVDSVSFGLQRENISQGRYPDGGFFRTDMPPTPRAPNAVPPVAAPPALSSFGFTPQGQVSIGFVAALGHSYQVEYKDDLAVAGWLPLTGSLFATTEEVLVLDPDPPATQRFYRVVRLD